VFDFPRKLCELMKLLVFGGTGLTGGLVVKKALSQGHYVAVLTRDASRLPLRSRNLTVIEGSARSQSDIEKALKNVDAVIHCLGIGGKGQGSATTVVSDSVKTVLAAMKKTGVRRIVCMSNVGAGGSGTWFYNGVVLPVFLRWLKPIIKDKDRMERLLKECALDWTSVRLPNIVEGASKPVRASESGKGIGISVTAESTAEFLLQQITNKEWLQKSPSISN
jgi:uncharacterized protein YbjT (DUF2867 family)